MKIVLLLAIVVASAIASNIPDSKCLHCICLHESGCRPLACREDVGSLSCGYYQMKLPYYEDAKQWSSRSGAYPLSKSWQPCSEDLTCANNAVYDYMQRYARTSCSGSGAPDCEAFARIHNGGPNGCHNSNTLGYWDAIKRCYES